MTQTDARPLTTSDNDRPHVKDGLEGGQTLPDDDRLSVSAVNKMERHLQRQMRSKLPHTDRSPISQGEGEC